MTTTPKLSLEGNRPFKMAKSSALIRSTYHTIIKDYIVVSYLLELGSLMVNP